MPTLEVCHRDDTLVVVNKPAGRSLLADRSGEPCLWDELPALVKRVALQAWPREQVASLTGADWLAFLDESYGGDGFANGPGRCLSDLAYGGGDGADAAVLVREWIRRHHA